MTDLDDTCESDRTGERLRPFRRYEVLHRALYCIDLPGGDGAPVRYTAEVDAAADWRAVLYADGRRVGGKDLPARFAVPGGAIEVDSSLYGISRVHFVSADGRERRLAPVRGTLEDVRGRFARRHPRWSRMIGRAAVAVLLVNLAVAAPQALELVTELPRVAERFGTFTSPVRLPWWLDTALVLAGAAAAVERVLTFRHNRLVDLETLWTNV
ncbi:hypothetical protein LO763_13580 [Glycomyces sp. A-F 0318]|uniref:hypothetical protein n=1 Tax=Glycomyces amatae TaxID=2881355 RepID=UPI001E4C0976|nr:hypothetical protein [Glycomyces amatae]MCD0444654.1 hypothetical protein [Glycomyces amatae]